VIVSIGIDIIEVRRVGVACARTPRFVERVFTLQERAYCDAHGATAAQHYAARFAAKEAALKALSTGWRGGLRWQDIEVVTNEAGAPALVLRNQARALFQRSGADIAHLTLSHTAEHAVAQVILERRAG